MKVSGTHTLHGTRQEVWDALQDPEVLVRTIPGCHELKELSDDSYTATVKAGIASIQGTYDGKVSLADQDEPNSYTLKAEGSGGPGTIDATATVSLEEAESDDGALTGVTYDAEAIVGGAIGGVGQRVLAGVAKRNAASFFEAVDAYLQGELEEGDRAEETGGDDGDADPAAGGEAERSDSRPRTFTAPGASADAAGGGAGLGVEGNAPQLVLAAVVGAAIALTGVLIGQRDRR